jgi:hypothetical protein
MMGTSGPATPVSWVQAAMPEVRFALRDTRDPKLLCASRALALEFDIPSGDWCHEKNRSHLRLDLQVEVLALALHVWLHVLLLGWLGGFAFI